MQIFQRFDVRPDSDTYELHVKTSLTIKPEGLFMHVSPRKDRQHLQYSDSRGAAQRVEGQTVSAALESASGTKPMSIFYGSNAGTCKALAYKLHGEAKMHGYNPDIAVLNTLSTGFLPTGRPVAIITASYEGQVSWAPEFRLQSELS